MKHGALKCSLWIGAGFLAVLIALGSLWIRQMRRAHHHCIKLTGVAFRMYAGDHGGSFPQHTNGFGDALLLLVKEGYLPDVMGICGPDDDDTALRQALAHGTDVPEAQCSRVYVPGLREDHDNRICLLFDRRSVPGGDHFYGHGPPIREICFVDGSMGTISDDGWVQFSRDQVERLVVAGWTRAEALRYYPEAGPAP